MLRKGISAMNREELLKAVSDLSLVMYRIKRSMSQSFGPERHPPLPHVQMHTLLAVQKNNGLNMTELSERMFMTRQQMTKIIDGLVERELVERKSNPDNRRLVLIVMSEKGEQFLETMFRHRAENMARLLAAVDDEDVERLGNAAQTLNDVLSKLNI